MVQHRQRTTGNVVIIPLILWTKSHDKDRDCAGCHDRFHDLDVIDARNIQRQNQQVRHQLLQQSDRLPAMGYLPHHLNVRVILQLPDQLITRCAAQVEDQHPNVAAIHASVSVSVNEDEASFSAFDSCVIS